MKARVEWVEHAAFVGETESGHSIAMDGPPEHGGRDSAPRPMETILIGLGGCTAFDVVSILRKGRVAVAGCTVEMEAERAPEPPRVFTRIHLTYIVSGRDINEAKVKRAIELSANKYCSATVMLSRSVEITHSYEIRSESSGASVRQP